MADEDNAKALDPFEIDLYQNLRKTELTDEKLWEAHNIIQQYVDEKQNFAKTQMLCQKVAEIISAKPNFPIFYIGICRVTISPNYEVQIYENNEIVERWKDELVECDKKASELENELEVDFPVAVMLLSITNENHCYSTVSNPIKKHYNIVIWSRRVGSISTKYDVERFDPAGCDPAHQGHVFHGFRYFYDAKTLDGKLKTALESAKLLFEPFTFKRMDQRYPVLSQSLSKPLYKNEERRRLAFCPKEENGRQVPIGIAPLFGDDLSLGWNFLYLGLKVKASLQKDIARHSLYRVISGKVFQFRVTGMPFKYLPTKIASSNTNYKEQLYGVQKQLGKLTGDWLRQIVSAILDELKNYLTNDLE